MKKRFLTKFMGTLLLTCTMTAVVACTGDDINDTVVETQTSAEKESSVATQASEETKETEAGTEESEDGIIDTEPMEVNAYTSDELLDQFVAGEISAYRPETESSFYITDIDTSGEEWDSYSIGDRIDLDNDTEAELILKGPYGGMIIDAENGEVAVLEEGGGTALEMSYVDWDNATWIVFKDVTHTGRATYTLIKHEGYEVADTVHFGVEFSDGEASEYDENSYFYYNDTTLTMDEYEALYTEIFE